MLQSQVIARVAATLPPRVFRTDTDIIASANALQALVAENTKLWTAIKRLTTAARAAADYDTSLRFDDPGYKEQEARYEREHKRLGVTQYSRAANAIWKEIDRLSRRLARAKPVSADGVQAKAQAIVAINTLAELQRPMVDIASTLAADVVRVLGHE
jgi:hypothetical protein